MSGTTSYVATTANLSLEQEIERLREDSLLSWKKEARIFKAAGLQDGMSILEAGSGPGFSTERLLKLFPNSRITCLDIAPAFLEHARKLLGKDADRVEFVEGSVLELPFAESSFDFVLARYLMQHLSDPATALRGLREVLRPGGKVVLTDIDDGLGSFIEPAVPKLAVFFARERERQFARGGNRLIGRRLLGLLKDAGFSSGELEGVVLHSEEVGVEPMIRAADLEKLPKKVRDGLISEQELSEIKEEVQRFREAPDHFIMVCLLMAIGTK